MGVVTGNDKLRDEALVCFNCGCPPPRGGEHGIYCSACGAEVYYVTSKEFNNEHPS
jgi:hypothetical protein